MPFELPISIKEVIEQVHAKKYLLPAIQREFVWKTDQISKLFDSIMRGYPIGSFLFWKVDRENVENYQFYEFIRNYHERDNPHNTRANVIGDEAVTAILDGQQRLSSLYIGLKGTYANKLPYYSRSNDNAYPKRKLYLNLLSNSKDYDLKYDFQFLTEDEAEASDENTHWFEVVKILTFSSLRDVNGYLREKELLESQFAEECLFQLFEVITEKQLINFFQEHDQDLDKVLNIFIRVNSGGTVLSYSDLLLSIATAQWEGNAREEITEFVDDLNATGDGFAFNKDFVLKASLVLADIKDIGFKVDNFNRSNMHKIEGKWDDIKKALRLTTELVASYGYNQSTLTSNNALIPIAYYILQKGNPSSFVQSGEYLEDRKFIRKWLIIALIKRIFSGQPDNVLTPLRNLLQKEHSKFPFDSIVKKFKGTPKSFISSDDDIENLLYSKYGKGHTFSVLSMLYPTLDYRNKFHIDHMHPRSKFNKRSLKAEGIDPDRHSEYLENVDYLPNLQLLEDIPNEEKSNKPFKDWLTEKCPDDLSRRDYFRKHYIPDGISLEYEDFPDFFETRKSTLMEAFKRELKT